MLKFRFVCDSRNDILGFQHDKHLLEIKNAKFEWFFHFTFPEYFG